MATITVEGIPSGLLLRLAAAAAANGRCLNSEVIVHLARSAGAASCRSCRRDAGRADVPREIGHRCRCRRVAIATRADDVGWGGPASGGAAGSGTGPGDSMADRQAWM